MVSNPYTALYGNPYTALYGYTSPLGAYQVMYGADGGNHHGQYRHMLKLMTKRIRLKKRLTRTRAGSKRWVKLKKEIAQLNGQIARVRAKLHSQGVNTQTAETQAATEEAVTATTSISNPDAVIALTTMQRRRGYRRRRHPMAQYRHKHVRGRQGVRTSAVRHHAYALRKRARRPWASKHQARFPGQRAWDGRRRQGPIAANELQQAADPAMQPLLEDDAELTAQAPVMDDDPMAAEASLTAGVTEAADEALSGIMDFASDLWGDKQKMLTYGAIGLGVWFLYKNMKRGRR